LPLSYKRPMNDTLLAFLVFQYDEALWITVAPKTVRKEEVWSAERQKFCGIKNCRNAFVLGAARIITPQNFSSRAYT
jgi:hypothetical protein